jgi:mono/diheme cytochrome c family protein
MRVASLLLVGLWLFCFAARAQDADTASEVRKGRHLAILLCTSCHVVSPDQPYAPTLSPPAPAFAAIARRNDVSAAQLAHFLTTSNQGWNNPNGMPNPNLAPFQTRAIIAYILSLRRAP